jgi:outer membrane receptor protein involved in Fe transport
MQGLRINVEYYRIKQSDTVFFPSAQTLVNDEAGFPSRVSRDAAGNLSLVDTSAMNLFQRETDGLDFSIDYETTLRAGRIRLRLTESVLLSLKTQYSATLPEVEAAGYHPEESGAAKRKMNGGVSWDRAGWSAGWNFRHFGSYRTYGVAGGPESVRFFDGMESSAGTVAAQGSQNVASQIYHDFYVGYSFRPSKGGRWLAGTKGLSVQLGVRNAFDKVPPLDAFYGNLFYLSPYGDAQLRTWWINIKTQF